MDLSLVVAVHLIVAKTKDKSDHWTMGQAVKIVQEASRRYEEEAGVKLVIKKKTYLGRDVTRRWRDGVDTKALYARYFKALVWAYNRGYEGNEKVRLYIGPAQHNGGFTFTYGSAAPCSYRVPGETPMAFIAASPKNAQGHDRYEHTISAVQHEVGHNLCIKHDPSEKPAQVMHPNALGFVTALLPEHLRFSLISLGQLGEFIKKLKG